MPFLVLCCEAGFLIFRLNLYFCHLNPYLNMKLLIMLATLPFLACASKPGPLGEKTIDITDFCVYTY